MLGRWVSHAEPTRNKLPGRKVTIVAAARGDGCDDGNMHLCVQCADLLGQWLQREDVSLVRAFASKYEECSMLTTIETVLVHSANAESRSCQRHIMHKLSAKRGGPDEDENAMSSAHSDERMVKLRATKLA